MKESDEPLRDGHPEHGIRLPQTRICVRGKGSLDASAAEDVRRA